MIRFLRVGVTLVLAICVLSRWGFAQDSLQEWAEVPPNLSGLVLFVDSEMKDSSISLGDLKAGYFDTTIWKSDLPVLRQYRLQPITYRIHLPG